jgi:hypothetical protein
MDMPDIPPLVVHETIGECTAADEAACGCVAGFRRCDDRESDCGSCDGTTFETCEHSAGVCRGPDFDENGEPVTDSCAVYLEGAGRARYCETGFHCVVNEVELADEDGPWEGVCMPTEYCEALSSLDPPITTRIGAVSCIYSDGTPFVDGPPSEPACPPSNPSYPFCGGVCGEGDPCVVTTVDSQFVTPCVGVSESRSFGVCAQGQSACRQGELEFNDTQLFGCELIAAEPCSCMELLPPREGTPRHARIVPLSVCRSYASYHPGLVECLDSEWNSIL